MRKFLFILFFSLTILLSVCVYAQVNSAILSLDVEGSADIGRNDVARAREEAIQNAIENAILKATAQLMSISVKDDRFQPVKSVIIDEPDKYVNNYKVVTEMKKQDSYQVNVHVTVNLVNLKNDLSKMGFMQVVQTVKTSPIVFINVKGLKKYTDFLLLKDFLQSRKKIVKNIYLCRLEWQQAHFEVEILGDVQPLIDELTQTGRYALDSGKTGNNQIEMTCLKKKEEE